MKIQWLKAMGIAMFGFFLVAGLIYSQKNLASNSQLKPEIALDNSNLVCEYAQEIRLTAATSCDSEMASQQDGRLDEFLARLGDDEQLRQEFIARLESDASFRQQLLDLIDLDLLLGPGFENQFENDEQFRQDILNEFNTDSQFRKDLLELIGLLRENR